MRYILTKKLITVGNSQGITISNDVIRNLGIKKDELFEVEIKKLKRLI